MTSTAAKALAIKTQDAYMAGAYGTEEWTACAAFLLEQGMTSRQAEAVLLSKHMRWADDGSVADRPTAAGFRHYAAQPFATRELQGRQLAKLVKETF